MDTPRTAADWHRYLHREGILVPDEGDECGPWHHRVFIEAAAPTLADLPRTRGDGTVAYEPSDEPAEPLDMEIREVLAAAAGLDPVNISVGIVRDLAQKAWDRLAAARPEAEHCCPPHSEKDCQYDCDGMCPCC